MIEARKKTQPFVTTIKDRCRVCYTCVRECPAKAIRIADGQAEVIAGRCIGCGHCVRVCSQKAKKVLSAVEEVRALIRSDDEVAAIVAPSFPAEFQDISSGILVGMIKSLGFDYVHEVGFGADLVALKMKALLADMPGKRFISSACPAVFGYIKRYHPELIKDVAPVVSPMIATARVLKKKYGPQIKVVFIGPCIAKKIEANSDEVFGEVNEAMTFLELRQLFEEQNILSTQTKEMDFDQPFAGLGTLFPIGRGLLEAAGIQENLVLDEVISANGKSNFIDAVMEFSSRDVEARFLDVLCCDGCIMGSGMTTKDPQFKRRAAISRYVRQSVKYHSPEEREEEIRRYLDIDLSRIFLPNDQRISVPNQAAIREVMARMNKFGPEDELNCGACGYDSCIDHAIAICKGLAETEMCLPYSIEKLKVTVKELNTSNQELAQTREALIQSEKIASMGQLSAGIAHEVNNPLGVVLMYAHLLKDEAPKNSEMEEDLKMIVDHADRAKKIVSGLLHFARQNKVVLKPVRVPDLIEDCLKSITIPPNIQVNIRNEMADPVADLDRDQMIQVIINFIQNGITAMTGGGAMEIRLAGNADTVQIDVRDSGPGIPKDIRNKIFEPFFTTKEIGKGTGLGLAITYGIVKMHRGDISVVSQTAEESKLTGTTFTVKLPRKNQQGGGEEGKA